jgi:hypothetical protein
VHGIIDEEILAIARAKKDGLGNGSSRGLAWIDSLDDKPWPFETEELVLV